MDLLAITILLATAIAGIATTGLLSGRARLTAVAMLLLGPVLAYVVLISPLPAEMHWTRDPGYDSMSWVPVAMAVAPLALVAAVIGLAVGQSGRMILRARRSARQPKL